MLKRPVLTALAVVGIILVAIYFRFYDIQNYPPGLFPDEAANGEDVQLILQGDLQPFYPRGNGREAMFFYLQALMVKLFGVGVWPMHAASALVGTVTVALMYFAVRPYFGRLAGVMAALLLATNHWHVTLSRTGFRAIMIPLCLAAFTAAVGYTIQSVRQQKTGRAYLFAALAGISFAAGFYTYIAYRVMVGVVLGIVFLLLLAALHPKIGFPHFRRYGPHLGIAVLAAIITLLPLGWYFGQHPQEFVGRAGQVSVFNPELQQPGGIVPTLWHVTRLTVRSFFTGDGDLNWRHNVAGYPFLNPLVAFLLLLGLAWTIHGTVVVGTKIMRGQEVHLGMIYPYIVLLLAAMLVPVITTAESIPHGLRSLGLVFPIFVLSGTAGAVVIHWIERRLRGSSQWFATGALVGLLLLGGIYDYSLYFLITRNSPEAYAAYRGDLTRVADYINAYTLDHPQGPRPYVVLDRFSEQTIHYLTEAGPHGHESHPDEDQHAYRLVDPATSHLTKLQPGEVIIFTQSTVTDAERYQTQHAAEKLELILSERNIFNQEIMRIYRKPGTAVPKEEDSLDA
jgi:4-amino-4-deoxy-L-arabinose transferase-like glycosyltransferase